MRREANRPFQCLPGMALLACLAVPPGFAIQSSTQPDQLTSASPAKPVIDADGTYHSGNGVTPPILVYSVDTEFSDAARRKKIEGMVVVGLKVGADGRPNDVRVVHSAAEGVKPKLRKAAASLDEKALEAVRQYRFKPGMYQGKPVPVAITIDVNFHIY
jgi:TonB family protein